MDNKGIIYLIQPCELIGTNRYKIGCSKSNSLDRVKNGYNNGTRYISINECNNPLEIEKRIKQVFNDKFTLLSGCEYFEGDENEMLKEFLNVIFTLKSTTNTNLVVFNNNLEKNIKTINIDDVMNKYNFKSSKILEVNVNNKVINYNKYYSLLRYIYNLIDNKKEIKDSSTLKIIEGHIKESGYHYFEKYDFSIQGNGNNNVFKEILTMCNNFNINKKIKIQLYNNEIITI